MYVTLASIRKDNTMTDYIKKQLIQIANEKTSLDFKPEIFETPNGVYEIDGVCKNSILEIVMVKEDFSHIYQFTKTQQKISPDEEAKMQEYMKIAGVTTGFYLVALTDDIGFSVQDYIIISTELKEEEEEEKPPQGFDVLANEYLTLLAKQKKIATRLKELKEAIKDTGFKGKACGINVYENKGYAIFDWKKIADELKPFVEQKKFSKLLNENVSQSKSSIVIKGAK